LIAHKPFSSKTSFRNSFWDSVVKYPYCMSSPLLTSTYVSLRLKCDGTRTETRFCLSAKWMSPFKSAGASVRLTTGSQGVRISGSNAGYAMFRGSVRVLATHSIRQVPLHFPSRASPCAIRFETQSTMSMSLYNLYSFCHNSVFWDRVNHTSNMEEKEFLSGLSSLGP
jgi:hypothetical protein